MEFLREEYTEVWAPSAVLPLTRFADRTAGIASTGVDVVGLPGVEIPSRLIDHLRSFHSIVSWYGTNRSEFRNALAGLSLKVDFLQALPDSSTDLHCADFFARQVGATLPALPRIPVDDLRADPVIVIHPFSGSARKNWPLERYQELAEKLPLPVQWCAGPDDSLDNALRVSELYELGSLIGRAQLYVGNDSGITHLAAAAGARVVAIFGPTNPAVWGPRGSHVRILHGQLEDIKVDNVLDAIHTLL